MSKLRRKQDRNGVDSRAEDRDLYLRNEPASRLSIGTGDVSDVPENLDLAITAAHLGNDADDYVTDGHVTAEVRSEVEAKAVEAESRDSGERGRIDNGRDAEPQPVAPNLDESRLAVLRTPPAKRFTQAQALAAAASIRAERVELFRLQVFRLHADGLTNSQIAERLGCTKSAVAARLKGAGLKSNTSVAVSPRARR